MNQVTAEQPDIRQKPETIWSRAFISLFLLNMVFNMGLNMSNSLLGIYADSLGATASAIGLVVGMNAISSMGFRVISAPVIDTYNRKYIVLLATVVMSVAFWGFGISRSIPYLIAFRLLQGCGMAFGNACCLTMVADIIPKDKYASGIGYYSLATVVASAVAPSVGLTLSETIGYQMTYFITAGIMLVASLLALLVKTEFKQTKKLHISFNNFIAKEALLPTFLLFLMIAGGGGAGSFLIIYARMRGVSSNIGLYFTVSAVTMLVTRPLIGKLNDKYGPVRVAAPALLASVVGFFIISFSSTLFGFLVAAFVSAFGMGACQPSMQALSMKSVPPDRRGAASCTNYIGMDLGVLIGPNIAGNLVEAFGYTAMWRLMVIPSFIAMAALFFFRGRIAKIENDFAEQQT